MIIFARWAVHIQEDYVIEFDIPMDYIFLMEIGKSTEKLLHNIDNESLWKMPIFLDELNDGASLAVLHNHVVEWFIVVYLIELDDVGMVELWKQIKLS